MMRIIEVLDMPPKNLLERNAKSAKFFDKSPEGQFIPKLNRTQETRKVKLNF